MQEMFESAVRSTGDLAGVFEFDGETGYFYLYKIDAIEGQKIIDSIRISDEKPFYTQQDVHVRWSSDERVVGLQIGDQIWAAFDCGRGKKLGGEHRVGGASLVPREVTQRFESH